MGIKKPWSTANRAVNASMLNYKQVVELKDSTIDIINFSVL